MKPTTRIRIALIKELAHMGSGESAVESLGHISWMTDILARMEASPPDTRMSEATPYPLCECCGEPTRQVIGTCDMQVCTKCVPVVESYTR